MDDSRLLDSHESSRAHHMVTPYTSLNPYGQGTQGAPMITDTTPGELKCWAIIQGCVDRQAASSTARARY